MFLEWRACFSRQVFLVDVDGALVVAYWFHIFADTHSHSWYLSRFGPLGFFLVSAVFKQFGGQFRAIAAEKEVLSRIILE